MRYGPGDAGGGAPADLAFNATGDVRKFVDYGEISSVRYVHVATLESLAPGRRYWYQVGDAKLGRWSKIFWFNARRTQEQYTEGPPLRIIALCDIGLKGSDSVVEFLTKEIHGNDVDDEINNDVNPRVDALVQCGDFAYDLDDQNGQVGDKFMAKMEPIAAYVPWMTSAGNHEASHNFTHYAERFVMPDSHKTNNHYYSVDVGPVHLVAYNTEALFWPGSFGVEYIQRMYDWMDADLASVDRVKTPWVIVHGHRPMYCPQYRELTADEAASGGSRRTLGEYVSGGYDGGGGGGGGFVHDEGVSKVSARHPRREVEEEEKMEGRHVPLGAGVLEEGHPELLPSRGRHLVRVQRERRVPRRCT